MRSGVTRFTSWLLLALGLMGLLIPKGDTPNRTVGVSCGYYINADGLPYTLYAQLTLHQERFLGTAVGVKAQVVFTDLKQPKAPSDAPSRTVAVGFARDRFVQVAHESGDERGEALFAAAVASPDGKVTIVDTSRYPAAIARFSAPIAAAAGALGLLIYITAIRRSKRTAGACAQCGYDLRSLQPPRACPECGKKA